MYNGTPFPPQKDVSPINMGDEKCLAVVVATLLL
jgi:hypothetical protein